MQRSVTVKEQKIVVKAEVDRDEIHYLTSSNKGTYLNGRGGRDLGFVKKPIREVAKHLGFPVFLGDVENRLHIYPLHGPFVIAVNPEKVEWLGRAGEKSDDIKICLFGVRSSIPQ
jgi:hypothetical protein